MDKNSLNADKTSHYYYILALILNHASPKLFVPPIYHSRTICIVYIMTEVIVPAMIISFNISVVN